MTGASEGLAKAIAAVVGGLGLLFVMKPGLLLGGLGKTLGKLLPGFGEAAAGGAVAGEAGAGGGGWLAAVAGLAARATPYLAALFTPGDTPKDRKYSQEQLDRDTDKWTKMKGYDRSQGGPQTRGRRDRGDIERERSLGQYLDNFTANVAKMSPDTAAATLSATVNNDNSQDNRDQSSKPSITINQTVQQATQAPMAAAQATGQAVGRAAVPDASRLMIGPAF